MMEDRLLDESAPPVAMRTPALAEALTAVSTAAAGRRVRRIRCVSIASVVGVLMVGGTSAAVASPEVRSWLGWEPDRTITYLSSDGEMCTLAFALDYEQKRNGLLHSEEEVYAVAMAAVDAVDLSPQTRDRWIAEERTELAADDPSSPWYSVSPADIEKLAVNRAVGTAMDEAFAEAGIVRVAVRSTVSCDRGGQ